MKALDTDLLVRYVTRDEPKQAAIAAKEIEGAAAIGEKVLIPPLVLCELVRVLIAQVALKCSPVINPSRPSFGKGRGT